jgi:DNA-binding winged helix-turn-helix (wHTH) protein/Tol biopolymer transport system component
MKQGLYVFGPYVLDAGQLLLRKDEEVVQLPPKVLETLLALVESSGQVVTKQQLMESVWPDSFVEEGNLTQNIFLLRRVLGKTAEGEEYIQTLPKRGYRMSVPVKAALGGLPAQQAFAMPEVQELNPTASRRQHKLWAFAGVILLFLIVMVFAAVWRIELRAPRVSGFTRITHDGAIKRGHADQVGGPDAALFTDGNRVYFMEGSSNEPIIAQVSASGGETGKVDVPFALPELLDVSRAGSERLVAGMLDPAVTPPLWVAPVPAGTPHRLSDVTASDASWAPNGEEMVFCRGVELFRARKDGSEAKLLVTLPGQGWQPRWSPDGQTLRLTVFDVKSSTSTIWQVSRDGTGLRPLLPGWHVVDRPSEGPANLCCGRWSPDGNFFVFQETRNGRSEIWSMRTETGILARLRTSKDVPVQITSGQLSSLAPVFSPDGQRLFVIGQELRGELQRFDLNTQQFVPYLSGISADFVDFSRDGQWITYVAYPEGTLWRCRVGGSERLQLTFAPDEAAVPKWSPDGTEIAFYLLEGPNAQRLYLISANGGAPRPASHGDGGEMQASWSPDARALMYSDFPFFSGEPSKVAIHVLDLKSQQVQTLPGSEGLFSPQWSPDGQHASAMALNEHWIRLFDFKTNSWTNLAQGFGLVRWSQDGQFLYYLRFGSDSAVMRIGIRDKRVEEVASLKGIRQTGRLAGLDFAITPDGSPLILRDIGTQEVYSLDWSVR